MNPQTSILRSLDVFLLICLIFVFGALLELGVTGMADPKGAHWWKKGDENQQENDSDVQNKRKKISTDLKEKCHLASCAPLLRRSVSCRGSGTNDVTASSGQEETSNSPAMPTAVKEDSDVGGWFFIIDFFSFHLTYTYQPQSFLHAWLWTSEID